MKTLLELANNKIKFLEKEKYKYWKAIDDINYILVPKVIVKGEKVTEEDIHKIMDIMEGLLEEIKIKRVCINCRYYLEKHSDEDKVFGSDDIDFQCRRYAPRIIHGVGTGGSNQKFANTEPESWCGEWEKIEEV